MSDPQSSSTSGEQHAELRQAAVDVLRALVERGYIAYFAGGCVRDRLMGNLPTDYDIATDARPEQVKEVFPKVQTVGESFGVMLVRARRQTIQVATFRTEGVYSDGRRPDEVAFTTAEHDASRRDFTINGLFEDPLKNQVIDYVGGKADVEARVVRAIGDPFARIHEDRLRMLRAIRFMAKFGFSLDPDTADAIRACAAELKGVSRERVGEELRKMFKDANRAVAAWELQYHGLDATVLQESNMIVAPTRMGRLPEDAPYATALAAWLLDRHGSASEEQIEVVADRWADVLLLANEERIALGRALELYFTLVTTWGSLGIAMQKRLAATSDFTQAVLLLQATDRQAFVDVRRRVIDLSQTGLAPTPLIDGTDLIAMGMRPGPLFSRVLEAVYDAQLEGSILEKSAALALARAVASTPPAAGM